ncbi:MAG: hypothetical protein KJ842_00335 [Candidatus Omnitrophica bacterium]|nr:hypothetical protein [Candidatus Omnitrophota bacterium]
MSQSGFNPKARWDRHIPQDSNHDSSLLNERIQAIVFFKGGKIYPRRFIWNNKIYKVKAINYNWQERQGKEIINYFSVNTGSGFYQISFNNTTLGWRLDKIIE